VQLAGLVGLLLMYQPCGLKTMNHDMVNPFLWAEDNESGYDESVLLQAEGSFGIHNY
jgi:hypothetical protein